MSIIFVVDVSGSMAGKPLEDAKSALRAGIDVLPDDTAAGIRSFSGACGSGGTLLVPVDTDNREQLNAAVDSLSAGGGTPTPDALRAAADDLPAHGQRAIILISDGQSTCGDPCPVAQELKDSFGIDFRVHTVGLGVPSQAENELACIASVTGGTYVEASDPETLSDVISDLVSDPTGSMPVPDRRPNVGEVATVCARDLLVRPEPDAPAGAAIGTLFMGESFRVERYSQTRRWAYGFAFGKVNKRGWVLAEFLCAFPSQSEARAAAVGFRPCSNRSFLGVCVTLKREVRTEFLRRRRQQNIPPGCVASVALANFRSRHPDAVGELLCPSPSRAVRGFFWLDGNNRIVGFDPAFEGPDATTSLGTWYLDISHGPLFGPVRNRDELAVRHLTAFLRAWPLHEHPVIAGVERIVGADHIAEYLLQYHPERSHIVARSERTGVVYCYTQVSASSASQNCVVAFRPDIA